MDDFLDNLSEYSPSKVVILVTVLVLVSSLPIVYILSILFHSPYTPFIFYLSGILPLLLTPPVIYILLGISRHLKYFKNELQKEVQRTKQKDILIFEQARFVLMGEMIANISHQWKQPLNTIGLAVVTAKLSPKENLDKSFEIIEDNVKYLSTTINDFLSFFDKRTHKELRTLDSIVQEVKSIIYVHISNKYIILTIDIDKEYSDIKVTSSISQVILNLLNNAKDALEQKEKNRRINLNFITSSQGLSIECIDNATGINQNILKNIFDPYFTTKSKTQGTGIGLYMSKEIVENMFNGTIKVLSTSNEGTTFHINLPYSQNCIKQE